LKPATVRQLVVCSDDAGWDEDNDGVIASLAQSGRISAVSVLVDGPHAPAWAQELAPPAGCALGLHLNLTWEPGQPSRGLAQLIGRCHARLLSPAWAETRIAAQLQRFEAVYGRPPDFVDGHQHVHMLPVIRERLLALLGQRYGAGQRPAVRAPLSRHWRGAKAWLLNRLGAAALAAGLQAEGWPCNSDFAGVYDFGTGLSYRSRVQAWLGSIDDAGLLMTHPGSLGPLEHAAARAAEADYLASAQWPADLRAAGAQLMPFRPAAL